MWSRIVFWELMDKLMGINLVRWLADIVKKIEMDLFCMIMRSIWFDRPAEEVSPHISFGISTYKIGFLIRAAFLRF